MKKTYKPEYFLGGIIERGRERREARSDFRAEKKRFREDARDARKEARRSKKDDIKKINQAKKDTIAEIRGNKDLTPAERRTAIREARQGSREDKKVRRKVKRTEMKGIRAAKKLDKKYAKSDKLRTIKNIGGIRGKIAGIRERKLDDRLRDGRGRIGRLQDKVSDSYYAEGFEDTGGYARQNVAARDELRKDIIAERAERNDAGEQQSDVEDRNEYGNVASETTEMNTGNENTEGNENDEGGENEENENNEFAGGGFNIKYDEGGMTIKLLKKLKGKTKNEKRKKLIQARIEKKEAKKKIRSQKKAGKITKEDAKKFKEQTKTTHDEETKSIKEKYSDNKQIEKMKKMNKGGNMTIPNYLVGGQVKLDKNKDGKISGADFKMMDEGGTVNDNDNNKVNNDTTSYKLNKKDASFINSIITQKEAGKGTYTIDDLMNDLPDSFKKDSTKLADFKNKIKSYNQFYKREGGRVYKHGGEHKKAADGLLIMLKKKSDKKKKK
tara:strand:+ start:3018 stop:4511 length:1494 start_codon:yes stop_codon:yes gene_type:complete